MPDSHLDHTGRLLLLAKRGHTMPVFATPATIEMASRIRKQDRSAALLRGTNQLSRHEPGRSPALPFRSADSVVRESFGVGSRGHGCPRSESRFRDNSPLLSFERRPSSLRSLRCLLFKSVSVLAVGLGFLAATPVARTQYLGPPQRPALVGPTVGASLRNAAAATHAQSGMVRKGAYDWGRRASAGTYNNLQFQQDFETVQFQFRMLREQFNGLASLALQLGRPRANNAV
jgi:hypothetical protein